MGMERGRVNSALFVAVAAAFLIISSFLPSIFAGLLSEVYPNFAERPTSWKNTPGEWTITPGEWVTVKPILVSPSGGPAGFFCGFCCRYDSSSCLFAVLIFQELYFPELVWSANRNRPVGLNATLRFTEDGRLMLADADGTSVWSTDTSPSKSAVALNLTENGNLVLLDRHNEIVWQSFDYPTDSLLPGQMLVPRKKIISNISASNCSQGLFSFSFNNDDGLVAYVLSSPPLLYYSSGISGSDYLKYNNGTLSLYGHDTEYSFEHHPFGRFPEASSAQYIRLGSDGHLRAYQWKDFEWMEVFDLTARVLTPCQFPWACGKYGICSAGQCSCPGASDPNGIVYFKQNNERRPDQGCSTITPISCQSSQYHSLLELPNMDHLTSEEVDITSTYLGICKERCLNNCSCKAALFKRHMYSTDSTGDCYLLSEVVSLQDSEAPKESTSILFLKVENFRVLENVVEKKARKTRIIIGSSLGALFGVFILIVITFLIFRKRSNIEEAEEDHLDCIPGMPTRFSYEDLKNITQNFCCKLGEGGFGSVFKGKLSNGTKVAVKHLEGLGHVKKSFLAEVETIGNIHHINLVRLIGFCAEKTHRLLVYEYMCNGSLDNWIFHGYRGLVLSWECRRSIILDIAKGLTYLHEDCRKKIYHLDIKPQNILLDEDFNAKISDFGLSKLIDKDQSQIVTIMRGTPGYLAPEWLSFTITEKVDVFSFGIVVLEIICGRRNIDRSQSEEDMHLLAIFKRKAEENQLVDMIDKSTKDMQAHGEDAVEMMKVGAWCLQSDFARRPSMSVVVKVLEGSLVVEDNLEYDFSYSPLPPNFGGNIGNRAIEATATTVIPSFLSGPR